MSVAHIRNAIREAVEQENQHGHMLMMLKSRLPELHHSITLPEQDPEEKVLKFVQSYIQIIPDCIAEVRAIASQAGIFSFVEPFLNVAEAFITTPPDFARGRHSLDALINSAYLTHRLIEEISDIFSARTGFPLVPLDLTMPNLLIHELIGEPYSNTLDQAVLEVVEQIRADDEVFQSDAFRLFLNTSRGEHPRHWDVMTGDLAIDLFSIA